MLSVHRLGAGSEGYYLDQVVAGAEDYYAGAGEAPGEWLASSALLGLEGRVDPEDLRAVLLGEDPRSGHGLHHGAGRSVPGWDLTFRAPKSVSVLWGLADPEISAAVVAAHEAAVKVGLRYVEEWAGFTRTGRGGATRVRAEGLIAAGFWHRTSRDGDPQLHTHVLVANSVRTPDGRWRTLDGRGLLVHMKTAGYIYDAQLRHELTERLGVSWGPVVNGLADIAGIDAEFRALFSKRRGAIEDRMAEWGLTSAKAAEVSALVTRRAKSGRVENTDELRKRWRSEAAEAGWTQRSSGAACPASAAQRGAEASVVIPDHGADPSVVRGDQLSDHLVGSAFEVMSSPVGLTTYASMFDRRQVIQRLIDDLPPGPTAGSFEETADRYLQRAEVVGLGQDPVKGERYSTDELLALEQRLADQVRSRRLEERSPEVMPSIVWSVFEERPSLSGEQRELISGVCRTSEAVSVIVAGPGTGKTFCLDSIRDTFQRSGYTTVGCALSAAAAHELEQGSGIESTTIARLRIQLDQRDRKLGPRSVLVVDEVGMVGTRALAPLLDHAASAGAKVILVGDPKQLPEIEAGGFLRHLASYPGVHTLTENRRQRAGWERDTIKDLAHGRVGAALDRMIANDGVGFILPAFGDAPVGSITTDAVRTWVSRVQSDPSELQSAKAYRLLRAILNVAVSDSVIARNPCVIRGAGQERSGERPLATAEQIHQLAEAIRPHLRALVLLAGFGGLRRGELLGLQRDDIDLVAGQLTVRRQVIHLRDGTREVTQPKSAAGVRTVSLPPFVVEALTDHIDEWTPDGAAAPVFVGERGGRLGPVSLQTGFTEARRKTGLTQFTFHDLRHAAGTMAAWTGATTKELMARLGHSTQDAALRYQHAARTRDAAVAEKLEALRSEETFRHHLGTT